MKLDLIPCLKWLHDKIEARRMASKGRNVADPCIYVPVRKQGLESPFRRFEGGAIIQHFKRQWDDKDSVDHLYIYIGEGTHTETGETFVLYYPINADRIHCRPALMFHRLVDKNKYPDAQQYFCFELANIEDVLKIKSEGLYDYIMR